MRLEDIETPAYVCEQDKLISNLDLLKNISKKSGARFLCALKGFAFSPAMQFVSDVLDGATCSGLYEAKYAFDHGFKEIHTYSPAFNEHDIDEILTLSNHIIFNSFTQWKKFKDKVIKSGIDVGLRVNPGYSVSPAMAYNPCAKYSRLGITRENFCKDDLNGICGLHFHALCEESAKSLEMVLEEFESKFGEFIKRMKWINFGGGHHITKKGYDTNLLVDLIKNFRDKYDVEIYIEPGEAVGWEVGFLVSSVLDIVENEEKICIIDASAECHMPDTVLMPYRPKVRGESQNGKFRYQFGGSTCLAGDVIGLSINEPFFTFDQEIKIGDKIIFEDQIHYTVVKNTTFNGIKLPSFAMMNSTGNIELIKEFGYDEFKRRN